MKALVADDDPLARHLLERMLKRLGYEVAVAGTGTEAWKQLSTDDEIRLVLLDWLMPDLDGLEITRRIREKARASYTYVILVTIKDRPRDAAVGLEAGADDFIAKPFDPDELRARVKAGERMLAREADMAAKLAALEKASLAPSSERATTPVPPVIG